MLHFEEQNNCNFISFISRTRTLNCVTESKSSWNLKNWSQNMHIFPDEIARFGCQVLWSTKELTCEIECHTVTWVLMDIQVENFIIGLTDLIASSNWSKYLYLFSLDCQLYQEVGLQFRLTKTARTRPDKFSKSLDFKW